MPDGTILKAFMTLILLVACFGAFFFVLKKFISKNKKFTNTVNIRILSRMPIQPKSFLYVVEAGDKNLLIGVNDHSISCLSDLSTETLPKESAMLKNGNSNLPHNLNKLAPVKSSDKSLSFGAFIRSTLSRQS